MNFDHVDDTNKTAQQKDTADGRLVPSTRVKSPDKRHRSYHDGHIDRKSDGSMSNKQIVDTDTMAWDYRVPALVDRRALKYACQKTGEVGGET